MCVALPMMVDGRISSTDNSVCMKSYRFYVSGSTTELPVLRFKYSHFVKLLLVRYSNACLRLYYKIYVDLITTLTIGALHFTSTPISTFSGAFVSEIQ